MEKVKTIAGWISFVSLMFALGVLGSVEIGAIGYGKGMSLIFISGVIGTISGLYSFRED